MFSQISRIPNLIQNFWAKRCGLYAGVYGTFHYDIPLFPLVFWEKEISAVRFFFMSWLTTKSMWYRSFSQMFLFIYFFRQLLLIGGVDPVEDIQKFKLDGWGLLLQNSDVWSYVKLKTQFWGMFLKKNVTLHTLPHHAHPAPPHPTMKVMLQPTV